MQTSIEILMSLIRKRLIIERKIVIIGMSQKQKKFGEKK